MITQTLEYNEKQVQKGHILLLFTFMEKAAGMYAYLSVMEPANVEVITKQRIRARENNLPSNRLCNIPVICSFFFLDIKLPITFSSPKPGTRISKSCNIIFLHKFFQDKGIS
jgi:hypothetical protein